MTAAIMLPTPSLEALLPFPDGFLPYGAAIRTVPSARGFYRLRLGSFGTTLEERKKRFYLYVLISEWPDWLTVRAIPFPGTEHGDLVVMGDQLRLNGLTAQGDAWWHLTDWRPYLPPQQATLGIEEEQPLFPPELAEYAASLAKDLYPHLLPRLPKDLR